MSDTTSRLLSLDAPALAPLRRQDLPSFLVTVSDFRVLAATSACAALGIHPDMPAPVTVKSVVRHVAAGGSHVAAGGSAASKLERVRLPNAFVPRLFTCRAVASPIGQLVLFADPAAQGASIPAASIAAPAGAEAAHLPRPVRFTWQTDALGRFTALSPSLAATLGPRLGAWTGRTMSELGRSGLLKDAEEADARIADGASFSGVVLTSAGEPPRRIEIGGIPLLDATKRLTGMRGFGLLWDEPAPPPAPPANVVPLRGGALSANEKSAFDEIARTLSSAVDGRGQPVSPPWLDRGDAAAEPPAPPRLLSTHGPAQIESPGTRPPPLAPEPPSATWLSRPAESPLPVIGPPEAAVPDTPEPTERIGETCEPGISLQETSQQETSLRESGAGASGAVPRVTSSHAGNPDAGSPRRDAEVAHPAEAFPAPPPVQYEAIEPLSPSCEEMPRDPEVAPPAPQPGEPHASAATSSEDGLLDRLPVGIAVQKDGEVCHINPVLAEWLGLDDEAAFRAAGGFEALLAREPDGTLILSTLDGPRAVDVRLIAARWRGAPALLHVLRPLDAPRPLDALHPAAPPPEPKAQTDGRQEALDELPLPVFLLDQAGAIREMNVAAEALCGFAAPELAGEPFTLLFTLDDQAAAVALLDAAVDGAPAPRMLGLRHRTGSETQREVTLARSHDTPPRFCLVAREIAPRETQDESEGEAASAPDLFARRLSHAVRDPLTTILAFVESVRGAAFGPVGNNRYAKHAEAAGVAAQRLLETLEDAEALVSNAPVADTRRVSASAVLGEALALLAPNLRRRGLLVRNACPPDMDVQFDPELLARLMREVLEEAMRASPAGGQIHISARMSETDLARADLILAVRDEGPVLTEADIATALSAYRAAPLADRFTSAGRPFRLARLALLAEANGGRLTLRRGLQSGMLCEIHLPR